MKTRYRIPQPSLVYRERIAEWARCPRCKQSATGEYGTRLTTWRACTRCFWTNHAPDAWIRWEAAKEMAVKPEPKLW